MLDLKEERSQVILVFCFVFVGFFLKKTPQNPDGVSVILNSVKKV